jgi:hypothetical protein
MPTRYTITPLGAAVMEAGYYSARAKRIQTRFTRFGECPISKRFDAEAVEKFYKERNAPVFAVPPK